MRLISKKREITEGSIAFLHIFLAFTIQHATLYIHSMHKGALTSRIVTMNYLEAKTVLLNNPPQVPLKLIAIEAAALVGIAGLLVQVFA